MFIRNETVTQLDSKYPGYYIYNTHERTTRRQRKQRKHFMPFDAILPGFAFLVKQSANESYDQFVSRYNYVRSIASSKSVNGKQFSTQKLNHNTIKVERLS